MPHEQVHETPHIPTTGRITIVDRSETGVIIPVKTTHSRIC
ncbi:MAG: hypothetical protein ABIR91_04980 [Candidatus Saccharimonadales bacterium]